MKYVGRYKGRFLFEASERQAVILAHDPAGTYTIARVSEHGRPILEEVPACEVEHHGREIRSAGLFARGVNLAHERRQID